ncbi:prolyl oligopeptidase family serine peptidase [Chitinivorax sp. B]|uniref:prolyl oligopeptidase family serine peptidase n=1 Tax=Chitinivorax sp. B TaxID=2502235 RepID=UPI0010F59A20|nr:prolyl oligopeptidase family serine peptidase [Chitinivorax sp. B]
MNIISRNIRCRMLTALCSLALSGSLLAQNPAPPPTPAKPVVDTYHGVTVTDPYRWMEDMSSNEFKNWLQSQAAYASTVLSTIPGRQPLQQRLLALSDAMESIGHIDQANGLLFYVKTEPGRDGRRLFVRQGEQGRERVLFDPDALTKDGKHFAIDFFSPSPNGKLVAIGISQGGSEDSVLRILEVTTGRFLGDSIDRTGLNHEGINWLKDSRRFTYNRLPPADAEGKRERYNKSAVYLHTIGQPVDKDQPLIGFGIDSQRSFEIADLPFVWTAPGSRFALANVQHGDLTDRSLYIAPVAKLAGMATPWLQLTKAEDQVHAAWLAGDNLYLLSYKDAPRGQLLKLDLATPSLDKAKVVIPAGQDVLRDAVVAKDAIYVKALDGGLGKLIRLPHVNGEARAIALPFAGSIRGMSAEPTKAGIRLALEGWTRSKVEYRVGADGKLTDTGLAKPSPLDFSQIAVTRAMVKSHDGVAVPLSILHRKGLKLDGSNPTILSGYGAYGITMEPRFSSSRLAWLERGGVMAIAHVRGGGEFGEEWHKGAYITNKVNTVLDFIACGEYLVTQGYTSAAKLAGQGGSAGGITVGGAITRRPDLFAAAHSSVGVSDMLRAELTPNGPPNIMEFGTVTNPTHFPAMLDNSAFHRIRDGVAYPAVISTTGVNDPRVEAWMPAKLAARLQVASGSQKPVLLRVDYDAGHGMGSNKSQYLAETADVWSFFLWQMGDPAFQPAH